MKKDTKWRAGKIVDERCKKLLRVIQSPNNTSIADARVEISGAIGELHREGVNKGFAIAIAKFNSRHIRDTCAKPIKVNSNLAWERATRGTDSVSANAFNLILERANPTGITVSEAAPYIKEVMTGVYLKAVEDGENDFHGIIRKDK